MLFGVFEPEQTGSRFRSLLDVETFGNLCHRTFFLSLLYFAVLHLQYFHLLNLVRFVVLYIAGRVFSKWIFYTFVLFVSFKKDVIAISVRPRRICVKMEA